MLIRSIDARKRYRVRSDGKSVLWVQVAFIGNLKVLVGATYNLESLDVVFACSHLKQILREISDCLVELVDIDAVVGIRPPRLHALPCASPVIFDHGSLGVANV